MSKTSAGRIPLIDGARSLSILLVLAAHLADMRFTLGIDTHAALSGYSPTWMLLQRNGFYGVSLFFLLSGFLITKVLVRDEQDFSQLDVRDFYVRRAARVLPLLLLTCLTALSLFLFIAERPPLFQYLFQRNPPTAGLWASVATFSFNWYRIWFDSLPRHFVGLHWGLLWSLSIEEQFYLAYPWLLKSLKNLKSVTLALGSIILLGPLSRWLCYRVWPENRLLCLTNSFGAFDLIAMGCLLYFLHRKTNERLRQTPALALTIVISGIALFAAAYRFTDIWDISRPDVIFGPSLLDAGLFLVLWGGLSFDLSGWRWLRLAGMPGEWSYGLYLWHGMILFAAYAFLIRWSPWTSFGWFVAINCAIGWLSFVAFERPANQWIRQTLGKQQKQS